MNKLTTIVVTLLLSLTSFVSAAESRPTMSQNQVLSLINAPKAEAYQILDVRTDEEFQAGHVIKATNISHSTLSDHLDALPTDKNQLIVVYCRSGRRAAMAEAILKEQGYQNVWHLDGDIQAWQANNLPMSSK
ncbi:rhodanese-like domain-containing protein [Colwellia sp. MEBiC06753]